MKTRGTVIWESSMDIKLTREQYIEVGTNMIVYPDGTTNKKCPICNNDVIVESHGSADTIKCKTPGCFRIDIRGI